MASRRSSTVNVQCAKRPAKAGLSFMFGEISHLSKTIWAGVKQEEVPAAEGRGERRTIYVIVRKMSCLEISCPTLIQH